MAENCENNEYCCGAHEVCEKGLSSKRFKSPVEYYDDEELDIFKGRNSGNYTPEEIEEFMDVFTTMYKSDVPGWLHSLQLREIEIPDSLKSLIFNS